MNDAVHPVTVPSRQADEALDLLRGFHRGDPFMAERVATVREALERLRRHPDAWSQEAFDQQKQRAEAAEAEVQRLNVDLENEAVAYERAREDVRRLTEGLREMRQDLDYNEGSVAKFDMKLRALLAASLGTYAYRREAVVSGLRVLEELCDYASPTGGGGA